MARYKQLNQISPVVKLTKKQIEALELIKIRKITKILFYGGARSGKTFLIVYYLCCKAVLYPASRHLILRQVFNDARRSIWEQTLLPMLEHYFIGIYSINKTDCVVKFKNGSEISLGGFDNEARVIKIMGREYNTILFNEMSQCSYTTFQILISRLSYKIYNEKKQICHNNFIGDCNPTRPTHWINNIFRNHWNPIEKKKINYPEEYGCLLMNPEDNKENLPNNYIERYLDTLTGLEYSRLRRGQWVANTEGLVYTLKPFNLIQAIPVDSKGKPNIAYYEIAVDWGYAHAFGLLVIARGRTGQSYVIAEIKKQGLQPTEVKKIILDKAKYYNVELGYCDTTQPGLQNDINENDIGFTLIIANKHREDGINKVRTLMEIGKNGFPKLFIIEPNCPMLIEECFSHEYKKLAEGLYSDRDVVKLNDDLLDPLRYWANTSPDESIDDWMNEYDKQMAV